MSVLSWTQFLSQLRSKQLTKLTYLSVLRPTTWCVHKPCLTVCWRQCKGFLQVIFDRRPLCYMRYPRNMLLHVLQGRACGGRFGEAVCVGIPQVLPTLFSGLRLFIASHRQKPLCLAVRPGSEEQVTGDVVG